MSYRREDIPGMIEALKAAKPYLSWIGCMEDDKNKTSLICEALGSAFRHDQCSEAGMRAAQSMIEDALFPSASLWSFNHYDHDDETIQRARHAWIDKMIADLESYR